VTSASLEFHHRDAQTKDFTLASFNGRLSQLEAEAAKCDLLCANCHRLRHVPKRSENYDTIARQRVKTRAVAFFGGQCSGCEIVFPPSVFEFHHRDAREKEYGVATGGLGRSWTRLVNELAKCVMLCANCHREVHAGVRRIPEPATTAVA
jgi:predicted HNH restriction endonuclease